MDWMKNNPMDASVHPGFALRASFDPDATGPVMFLDFDGVINAVTKKGNRTDRNVWADYTYVDMPSSVGDYPTYPVNYSPTVVAFLHEMVDAGVELVWLTTWSEDTAYFPDMIGTPVAKWLGKGGKTAVHDNLDQRNTWWKLDQARDYAGARDVIWVDDDHWRNQSKVNPWVNSRSRYASTLILSPQERLGMTKKMLKQIRTFVDERKDG